MLNIFVVIIFGFIAFRISKSISNETATFVEYRQSTIIQELVFLFPVGPIALFFGVRNGSMFIFLLAVVCYLPALIVAYKTKKNFEKVETDMAYGAIETLSNAFATAVGGILYVGASFLYSLAVSSI